MSRLKLFRQKFGKFTWQQEKEVLGTFKQLWIAGSSQQQKMTCHRKVKLKKNFFIVANSYGIESILINLGTTPLHVAVIFGHTGKRKN